MNFVGEPHKYNGIFALFHLMNSLSFLKNVKDLWNKILKLMKILTSRYNVEELSSAPFYGGDRSDYWGWQEMAGILALMCELLQKINKNAWCGFDWV